MVFNVQRCTATRNLHSESMQIKSAIVHFAAGLRWINRQYVEFTANFQDFRFQNQLRFEISREWLLLISLIFSYLLLMVAGGDKSILKQNGLRSCKGDVDLFMGHKSTSLHAESNLETWVASIVIVILSVAFPVPYILNIGKSWDFGDFRLLKTASQFKLVTKAVCNQSDFLPIETVIKLQNQYTIYNNSWLLSRLGSIVTYQGCMLFQRWFQANPLQSIPYMQLYS